ncbi:MAG TPA: hypothetical protein VMT42_05140, partial [candidate division Zixibacteria bacterium]|nr:hypothetical protein [candidate division Zixibacteria bacterium]
EEIEELLRKNRDLHSTYLRMMGKANLRSVKRRLRTVGVKRGWFAIADDVIVAGSKTKEDLEMLVEDISQTVEKNRFTSLSSSSLAMIAIQRQRPYCLLIQVFFSSFASSINSSERAFHPVSPFIKDSASHQRFLLNATPNPILQLK